MMTHLRATGLLVQFFMQRLAFLLVISLGLGLAAYSLACLLGYAPWLTLPLQFGETRVPEAGIYVQLTFCALAVGLMFFLPANARMMALENSHRRFHIGMKDVARAYAAAHRADREGVFTLSSEFDSVRERIAFLRDHPDLGDLEPSVLEVAAQMSHISRELAQTYSGSNIQRARDFLTARQQEIEDFNERLDEAKAIAAEMRQWHMRVSLEEDVAEAQLARLCEELEEILPEILPEDSRPEAEEASGWVSGPEGFEADEAPQDDRIVAMLSRRAAE
ncbi:DNA repair protein [Salipiger sp. P9]|uniref:DNA repair protein n=1 Tax=Salipiger pentaromativorans TaxID=2943193 RepID=UPI00215738BB|nr:DNA repair protein [Salipiger pentaromativorans]MCR8550204.1 DNA repair protein [Salipiger pentaromativorans]